MVTTKLSFLLGKRTQAMVLFPFIIIRKEDLRNVTFLNHEKIHIKQHLELLIIGFYIWYFAEYLVNLIRYRNSYRAYMNISFEKEAYANQGNLNYLKSRKFYSFLKFI